MMNAYIISNTKHDLACVWALNPAHACYVAQLLGVTKFKKGIHCKQINGHPNRWKISATKYEISHFGDENNPPAIPAKNFKVEFGRIILNGEDIGLCVSQTATQTELFLVSECKRYITYLTLPHHHYDLSDWSPSSGLPGYLDFEKDIKAIYEELKQLDDLNDAELKASAKAGELLKRTKIID